MPRYQYPLSAGAIPLELPFAPDTALRWNLISAFGKIAPSTRPYDIGAENRFPREHLARALFADGSLRPGRLQMGPPFGINCDVACELALFESFDLSTGVSGPAFQRHEIPSAIWINKISVYHLLHYFDSWRSMRLCEYVRGLDGGISRMGTSNGTLANWLSTTVRCRRRGCF